MGAYESPMQREGKLPIKIVKQIESIVNYFIDSQVKEIKAELRVALNEYVYRSRSG